MTHLDNFLIFENATIRDSLFKINLNQNGVIIVCNLNRIVIGLATDGDIREALLTGKTIDDQISSIINRNFIWADSTTSKEILLKKLDNKIKLIPILDNEMKLIDIVSYNYFPKQAEEAIYVRAKSPVRISFGGGGSDLTHYFINDPGAVINATINIYAHALLKMRNDDKINITSSDLNQTIESDNLESFLKTDSDFGLIQATIKAIQPQYGFDLQLYADFPMKSGLGGSAVVSATVLGCFNELRKDKFDSYELAELAYQAERIYLGVSGGWQDQYATIFGGMNFMEFKYDKNNIYPLRIPKDIINELEENLILCYTGKSHDSGEVHDNQKQNLNNIGVKDLVKNNVALTYDIRDQLLRGKLNQFGNSLHLAWEFKKKFGDKISSPEFDALYTFARNNGAIGGKLLGAGGGGYFLFYCNPFMRQNLVKSLIQRGNEVRNFKFDEEGLRTWIIRDTNKII